MEPPQPEEINHEGNGAVTMGKGIKRYGVMGFQRDEVGVYVHVMNICHVFDVMEYFEEVNIPVNTLKFHFEVCEEDVRVAGEMLTRKPDYAVIFAFAVTVTPEAWEYADQIGVKIYYCDAYNELDDHAKAFLRTIRPTPSLEHPAV